MAAPRTLHAETDSPALSRAMLRGTAKQLAEGQDRNHEGPGASIVTQAEREDFQEFCPTTMQFPSLRVGPLPQRRPPGEDAASTSDSEEELFVPLRRKQRRKTRAKPGRRRQDEPPIIRGFWVQEIDWLKSAEAGTTSSSAEIIPPPPQFTDPPCDACADVSPPDDEATTSESVHTHDSETDSSRCAEDGARDGGGSPWRLTLDLLDVSGFAPSAESGSGSERGAPVRDVHAALERLRGNVTRVPKRLASLFFKDLNKRGPTVRKGGGHANEGLIFHNKLKPDGRRYREGEEYRVLHHIQNGSYGDVFCVRDERTGFRCAAKKIPLAHFSHEEVSTWSALRSPRVVELFGAVREGPNVVLFMDLKPACLAQLLKEMHSLPEDLALHYLHQTLGALEHLHHRRVLHLDVKADNVLLSADCRDTFLCDFGLSETAGDAEALRGAALPGTETHMAPEVARGAGLCSEADVWSSCCMLLHMLNGCHPWVRFYSHPLCLHIVEEPPPLWEVPSNCNNFTAKVFAAGLRKDPEERASAKELRRKTTKALRAVGGLSPRSVRTACERLDGGRSQTGAGSRSWPSGLTAASAVPRATASAPAMHWVSPWRTAAVDEDGGEGDDSDRVSEAETDSLTRDRESWPKSLRDDYASDGWDSDSEVDIYMAEEDRLKNYEGDGEEDNEREAWRYRRALRGVFPLLRKGQRAGGSPWGSDVELEYLRDGVLIDPTIQTPSPEPRDDPPSCFSCSDVDPSEKESDHSSDDLSSGVFSSCNSQTDGQMEWPPSAVRPPSYSLDGVDIWIQTVQGECLRIRERQQVKVGHVAIGISSQVSGKTFTLETLDRKSVSFEQEVRGSGLWLRCVPAPDGCQRWRWRVRDGELEVRE